MLIPSSIGMDIRLFSSLSRRVNANSQREHVHKRLTFKLIKKGEC